MTFVLLHNLILVASSAALVIAVCSDLRSRIIPDTCSAIVAVSGLLITVVIKDSNPLASLMVAACLLAGLAVLSGNDVLGGGDVKLISAVSFLFDPGQVLVLLCLIAVSGGVIASVYALLRAVLRNRPIIMNGFLGAEASRIVGEGSLPYAAAIASGAAILAVGGI